MGSENYKIAEVSTNLDYKRIPLSSAQREKRKGSYRYFGAQGVIDYIDDYIFEGTYLLIAEDGENLKSNKKNIAQIVNGRFWVNNHAHILQANDKSDLRYLYYALCNTDISGYITGSAQPKLSQGNLNNIVIQMPGLETQRNIAATLSCLDDKIELNNRIIANLEAQAQAIFKSWFVDFEPWDGIEPTIWKNGCVGEISKAIFSGGTPDTRKPEFWVGDIPWLSSGETRNHFITTTDKTISKTGVDQSSTRLAKRYSVVMASAGQGYTRGQTSLLLIDTYVNQSIVVIECDDYATYVYLSLSGRYEELRGISDSSSIRGSITTKMISAFPLLIPDLRTVKEFSSIVLPMIHLIENLLQENRNLVKTRDTLLPKLMSGEIEVPVEGATEGGGTL